MTIEFINTEKEKLINSETRLWKIVYKEEKLYYEERTFITDELDM